MACLDAYFAPLAHCFYHHDLVFMPSGENVILLLEHHEPSRVPLEDIAKGRTRPESGVIPGEPCAR